MVFYPESAVERAMKIQEVILRAMAKRLTWCQAAEIIGISDRQMRRWYRRYQEFGYDGLFDRRRGRPSPKRVAVETVERMLGLYRDRYFDLNVQHFCEKLREEHSISLSYTWVKTALQGAGLVRKGRRRGAHRRRRLRRPLPGMLVHLDGSRHRWFQDDRWYDLLVVLDDATTEVYYAQLVEEESTRTVLAALRETVQRQGIFCALYSDRASHFFATPQAGGKIDPQRLTQVGRALQELGIQMIPAYSPQAADVRNEISALGRGGFRRNCACAGSPRWKTPTSFYATNTSPSSTGVSGSSRLSRAAPSCLVGIRIWTWSSPSSRPARWRATIPFSSETTGCRSSAPTGVAAWPDAECWCTSIWMATRPFVTDRTWSGAITRKVGRCWNRANRDAGRLWKSRSVENHRQVSHCVWKSRNTGGISTFPRPGRRRKINPNRTDQVLQKPDILIC